MVCQATSERSSRRELLGIGILLGAAALAPAAKAGIVEELLEKSTKNKELNDKKRLYTSYANLARSRTVADGTCAFPTNFVGCDIKPFAGNVKYITDDIELECQGEEAGHCISEINMKKVAP
eukprot:evm.model.scf_2645.2 EVM.evm.TU.scf_2645.2   scf_2645:6613-10125(-)